MEQKKVTYTGLDTEDVTQMLEEGNRKQAEKGWQEYRVDMLSSSTVRVTLSGASPTRTKTWTWTGKENSPTPPSHPTTKEAQYGHRAHRRHSVLRRGAVLPASEQGPIDTPPPKRRRLRRGLAVLALCCALLLAGVLGLSGYVVLSTRDRVLTAGDTPPEGVDCILVLGCGVYADGSPTPMLYDRLARGVELYGAGWSDVLLLSGDNRSADYNELATMDRVAQDLGAPAEAITLDYAGLSTYDSLYRAREIFGVTSLVIVTQDYHLSRALYLAEALGLEAWGVAAEGEDRPGQLYRELREILARDKDFFWAIFQPEATILGEPEPLT